MLEPTVGSVVALNSINVASVVALDTRVVVLHLNKALKDGLAYGLLIGWMIVGWANDGVITKESQLCKQLAGCHALCSAVHQNTPLRPKTLADG